MGIEVTLVRFCDNKADCLTRVEGLRKKACGNEVACFGVFDSVRDVHEKHHFGAHKTLYSCLKVGLDTDLAQVRDVIRSCGQCASIDPAPVTWKKGSLAVTESWWRLACDVTHWKHTKYFTVVDCGPSRFCIWRRLVNEDGFSIGRELLSIFRERGPPVEVLFDNGLAFKSEAVRRVCEKFWVKVMFRCAYRPSGNGVVERNHRTIKRTAPRAGIDPLEAVFWYNLLPLSQGDATSVPSSALRYRWRFPGAQGPTADNVESRFAVGERVFVKPQSAKCSFIWE